MAGDFFLLLEMRDLDKLKSKLEIIMEKTGHDTCQLACSRLLVKLGTIDELYREFGTGYLST